MSVKRTFVILSIVALTLVLVGCVPPAAPAPAAQPAQQAAAQPAQPAAAPAAAAGDKWCQGIKIRYFVGGEAGDAFASIVYKGAQAAQADTGADVDRGV